MWTRMTAALVTAAALLAWPADARAQQRRGAGKTVLWTSIGAGAGFGLGVYFGLRAFDDAINSDRKVWTAAIAGAAAGGVLGYFVSRGGRPPSSPSRRQAAPLSDREVGRLAGTLAVGPDARGTPGPP